MRRNLIFLIAIIIPILFIIIAYKVLVQGGFPWIFLFVLAITAMAGLLALGPTLFQRTDTTGQPQLVKMQLAGMKAVALTLVGIILYDYSVRHILRWETYTALVVAQFIVWVIVMLLSRKTD